jgi:hypothetical protein
MWSWIPPSKQLDSIQLVFTTREHGTHISTLYTLTENISPMLLIILCIHSQLCVTYHQAEALEAIPFPKADWEDYLRLYLG